MSESEPIGVLVMAYGTASGPDDIERYYTDIRGGRTPTSELLAVLKERYAIIGNRFPLHEITRAQAEGLERELNDQEPGRFRTYLGMKHSPPWIADALEEMRADGIRRAVGIVMAPHWSGMSVGSYRDRVERDLAERGGPAVTFVERFHDHPMFIDLLEGRVAHALATLGPAERENAIVMFSAHSLPVRALDDGTLRCKLCDACPDGCRYEAGLRETAERVSQALGLMHWTTAWQSAGRTADPWWGPPIEDVIPAFAEEGHRAVVVCSAGFVADHLEILYDLDVLCRGIAEDAGMHFARTEMPNADPAFTRMLAAVIREHLAEPA
ncbi:MAG: ferrochelatase [Actinobacteria bacterium RBG_19FT_COMBO_70_19]|nr:MAG: ferrochelatase [Actinobacteria bacterium RBG_19FT_COMBO_70_19]